ncbi:formate dehydrogenase accessory protein FdhE [Maridesulfovibrio salexigens]|uniref:Formate dehydrogenase accessory protein n=1 Tax=Maridesulfovibrio salexigens (strain ATCC 14822 / DSM 2638 / NCIMB 8403 / VKM B-1763) TaxID=526222 RepID=C6C059_MARSD|nr:formate dehydrogenase accessory protein FdhE [Maridesulfovibrio salexigens]ACS80930.1 formate dehydrogenase accessory protein [Maridesulfovibrio salexigens DSM 2638]
MNFDYSSAKEQLDKKVSELREKPFLPEELVNLISNVAAIQLEAQQHSAPTIPTDLAPEDANLQGRPLLARENFTYDYEQACKLVDELAELVGKEEGPIAEATTMITASIKSGELDLKQAFKAYLETDDDFFMGWAEKMPEAPRTLSFLVQSALTPSIKAVAAALEEKLPHQPADTSERADSAELDFELEQPAPRSHGHCPICGSVPFMHTLHHQQGFRYANCSFCHTEYRVRRMACAYCDNTNADSLKFFTVEEAPGYRVDVCDSCKTYMKTADFREVNKVSVPALNDLESLPLDFVAVEEGYNRGTLSVWGF